MDVLARVAHVFGVPAAAAAAAAAGASNNTATTNDDDNRATINTWTIIFTTALALVLPALLLTLAKRLAYPTRPKIYPSPLRTLLPQLSAEQQSALLYPPDYFPGARDVVTPYGSVRCYEFGPANGRRVLLMHGISTSCMTLTHIAHGLVQRGNCRVLLFDLFGRGFSDGVGDVPHDERLYVTQALLVLASSELAWMGSNGSTGEGGEGEGGFHIMGYSLGGALAVHLANALPAESVKSITLLAPAGMIREQNFGTLARFIFRSGWVPDGLLEILTRWRLKRPIAESAKRKQQQQPRPLASNGLNELKETMASSRAVLAFVNWQVIHHAGFTTAFMSTLRHAPMFNQQVAWRTLTARRRRHHDAPTTGKKQKTVCLIFGAGDEIVSEHDYRTDALLLLGGEDEVFWPAPVAGAHDFPMVDPEGTLDRIWEFWGWDS
ncbi:Alpha/Beta hydrolase protein [Coniella lustricola]|uniref:Alpha/Beta hydrolase protein n=1 Tax=Coniella lustricola TaxID=2025994 RepID=A0A2T3AJ01_9PEZI|nr:Alpha/Beta hydrolase protein [Coniella lustricola]